MTGQPVYSNSVSDLTVAYAYGLRSAQRAAVSGTEQLVATIDNGQGVVRSFALQPPTPFRGDGFRTAGVLHLSDLQSAASAFEQMASVDGSATYVVTIAPDVTVRGHIAGQVLGASFDHPAQFNYRPATTIAAGVLSPIHSAGRPGTSSGGAASVPSAAGTGPITATANGSVTAPGGRPARLFLGLSVQQARIAAPILLAGALLGVYLVGRRLLREITARDERRRISARHGGAMVDVDALPPALTSTVEVSSFEGLLKVARRLGSPLLHQSGKTSIYAVVDGATVYRYVVGRDRGVGRPLVEFDPHGMSRHTANGHLVSHRS
jgi:hypothetical protein